MKSAGRHSCDTVYQDAQSSAGEDTVSEPGSATDAGSLHDADGQSEWLSEIIGLLWVDGSELREAFHKVAWDILPDLLQESSPPWMHSIKLTRLVLGDSPPVISNVSSFRDNRHDKDWAVAIECDITWESKMDIKLHIKPMPKKLAMVPAIITKLVSNSVMFTAGIEELKIKGRIRVACNPLIPRLPVIAALKAGFTEQPDVVDFKVRIMGGSTLAGLVPSLKAWFVRLTRDSIISYYVLPEQWTYRLAPDVQDINVSDGMLSVTVVEAQHIPKGGLFTESNPYVSLWLRSTQRRQTSVQPAGKSATWNENFHLPVEVADMQKLVVVLYDHDTIGSDDELGRLFLPVSQLTDGEEQDMWLDLQDMKEQVKQGQRESQHDPMTEATKRRQKQKSPTCRVRLKLRYQSWTKDEMSAIAKAQKEDDMGILYDHPKLRGIANQGVVNIKLAFADRLVPGSLWRGPRKHLQVKCMTGKDHKRTLVKHGTRHSCRIDETIQLQVTASPEQDGDDQADDIVIEVRERKWRQNSLEGRVVVSLHELKEQGTIKSRATLKGGKSTDGRLEFEMEWKSYLGIHSAEKESAQ